MKNRIYLFFMISLFFSCQKNKFQKTYYRNGKIETKFLVKDDVLVYFQSYYKDGKINNFFDKKQSDTLFVHGKKGRIVGKKIMNEKGTLITIFYPNNFEDIDKDYIEIFKDTLKYGRNWIKLRYHTSFPHHINDKMDMKVLSVIVRNSYKNKSTKLDTFGFNNKHFKNGVFEAGFGINIYNQNIDTIRVNIKIIKDFYYIKEHDSLNINVEQATILLNETFYIKPRYRRIAHHTLIKTPKKRFQSWNFAVTKGFKRDPKEPYFFAYKK